MRKYRYYVLALVVVVLVVAYVYKGRMQSVPATVSDTTKSFQIGVIEPLTGMVAYLGEQNKKGVDLAKEILEAELPETRVNLLHEDSLYTPKGGLDAYQKLRAGNKLDAIITFASPISIALRPVANGDGVLQVAVSTSAKSFASPKDLSVRVSATTDKEITPAVKFMHDKGFQKLAVLYMQNEIGESVHNSLLAEAPKGGVKVVADEAFPVETTDFRSVLTKIAAGKPDAVYVAGTASHLAHVLEQSSPLSLNAQFMSFRIVEDTTLLKVAGDLANGVIYTYGFDPYSTAPEVLKFVQAYQKRYGELPDGYAAEGYEGVRLTTYALRKCGIQKECLINYFSTLQNHSSIFGPLSFDENGDVNYEFYLKTVKDGKFVRYAP